MTDAPTDPELLRRYAADDDADAFGVLVRRHRGLVYGTCARVLRPGAAAEDAAQETFVRLMRHAGEVTTSLPAWLHRVAVNLCRDHQRSEAARRVREETPRPVSPDRGEPPGLRVERHELEDRLDAALDALPQADRVLLVEHFLREVPQSVIAEREGVSRATLSRRVGRALVALRTRMQADPPDRRRSVTAAATLAVLMLAGNARAAPVPDGLAEALNRLTMVSGTTASGIEEAPPGPAPPPPPRTTPSSGGPSPLAFTLVFLVPLFAMILCAALAAGVYLSAWTTARTATEMPVPQQDRADTRPPDGVFAVPGPLLLRSDRIASFSVDGGTVALVYGDGHTVTVERPEADRRLRAQTGRSLLDLMMASP